MYKKEREDFVHRQLNKFNRGLERFSDWYGKVLARLSHRLSLTVITLLVFAAGQVLYSISCLQVSYLQKIVDIS